ncbi:MAG: ABC transporter permease [Desulfobacter postgatei]|uniref:ABC transporter permease n=1 Tax=Desulfobacter postgatei TaxID=2293 RepID=UPI0023F3AE82|nr:ABC transporter permease [Desulfobacter postgatei]MDD4274982.1 ABC transporter permease [Desulfobacter postgatei]
MNLSSLSKLLSGMTPSGRAGLFVLGAVIFLALAAPMVCSHSHRQMSGPALIPPGPDHIMGTDELGVDLWAQICHGARISLLVGMGTALAAGLGGGIAGIVSGYTGGIVDMIIMRMVDVFLVLPDLPVMIVLAAFFSPSLTAIVLVLSCFSWVHTARIVRSRVLALKQRQYIRAAELNGASVFYLIRRHFLPEVFPLAAVSMIRLTGRAIVAEAGLSFLGLGDPSSGSWGLILHHATSFPGIYYTRFWQWWLVFPWFSLTLMVVSLALVSRDMEKIADPRLGKRS